MPDDTPREDGTAAPPAANTPNGAPNDRTTALTSAARTGSAAPGGTTQADGIPLADGASAPSDATQEDAAGTAEPNAAATPTQRDAAQTDAGAAPPEDATVRAGATSAETDATPQADGIPASATTQAAATTSEDGAGRAEAVPTEADAVQADSGLTRAGATTRARGAGGLVPAPASPVDETVAASVADAPGNSVDKPAPQVPEHIRALQSDDHMPDPLLDMEQRRLEAGVDKLSPFGRPGQPLGKAHPFVFGFTAALGVICAWLLVQAVINARQVIVLIVVSMFLAVGLNPAVERLQRARLPRGGAVAVVFLGLVLAFVGIGFAIVPPVTEGVTDFIDHLPGYIQQLQDNPRIQELDRKHQVLEKAQKAVTDPNFGQTALDGAVGVGKVVLGGIFSMLTVLILTLYFLGSLPTIKTFFYRLAPRSRRARVALLGDEILVRIGGYVAGTITVAFIAGTIAYVFLMIMGLKFALPLALVVSITALIPLVGATIGATLVSAVAFFEQGTIVCIVCAIFFLIYQQVENYLIHPRVMKRAVDVQPAVTIIAALIGGTLLGIVGALLAIPTAAAIALIIREVVVPRQETL